LSMLESDLDLWEAREKTVMILAVDGEGVGLFAAMGTLKETAAETVKQLNDLIWKLQYRQEKRENCQSHCSATWNNPGLRQRSALARI